tara:strand:- start:22 stop:333 length:312 start_codon:yes stop_codon:yes gene_type:complete
MAKTKTKKVEEVIDLSKPEKITDEQLAQLQSSIKTIENLTNDIGSLEMRKYSLMKAMESIHSRLENMRKDLKKEYGTDNINLKDGEISYEENPIPQENGQVNS